MARIMLVDSDEIHAKTVASALGRRGHQLIVYADTREALHLLSKEPMHFAVVILNFSNRPEDWDSLNKLRKLTLMRVPRLGILCLSRSQWGTDVRLRVERKGARLVYERS
jgi:ActR/RegA family two-component response regulator